MNMDLTDMSNEFYGKKNLQNLIRPYMDFNYHGKAFDRDIDPLQISGEIQERLSSRFNNESYQGLDRIDNN